MEWSQIVGFRHVARCGSITKAAKMVCRTQSALSQQIKALETELGCLLFERAGKRLLRITEEGETMLRFADAVLTQREILDEEISALQGLLKGSLSMAAPFTTIWQLLPDRLRVFQSRHPDIELKIFDRPQRETINLVETGEADIGFAMESEIAENLVSHRWKKLKPFLVVPTGHPLLGEKAVTLEEVVRFPLILSPGDSRNPTRSHVVKALREKGLTYKVSMESSNVELNSLYVRSGLGLAFAMVAGGEEIMEQEGTALVPLAEEFPEEYLAIFTRSERSGAPVVKTMISFLQTYERDRESVCPLP